MRPSIIDESLIMIPEDRNSLFDARFEIQASIMKIDENEERMATIYEQFLASKNSNRMFQQYNNFSHHESVFSYNEENVKIFNVENISQLIIVSLTVPFTIKVAEGLEKADGLFGRYARIKFEENKKDIAWNVYNALRVRLGSKLSWFGCVFDSYPLEIREDIRNSLSHTYGIIPIFVEDLSYSKLRNDAGKLTSYNEFKDGELEDNWTRINSFNQCVSQYIAQNCHAEATMIFLHKEFMLVPQLLIQGFPKLHMSFYWDESFPSALYRTRSIYHKQIVVESLLNCHSIIFTSQNDLRNFVDYCVTKYSCQIASKRGTLILKHYGRQITIDSKSLLLQPVGPEFINDQNFSSKLHSIDQFLAFVAVFTLGQHDRVEQFLMVIRGTRLLKGGRAKLFVICEGFDPPNCQYILDSSDYQRDLNLSIELLRIDDHSHTLEFLKRCDILIDEQNADVSFNNLKIEFMIVNAKRALCLANASNTTAFQSGNVGKCDFTNTKELERGINKLIDKLLLQDPPATSTEIEKFITKSTWQSYEEVISAI